MHRPVPRRAARRGVTLVEVLVALAIVSVLVSLALPAVRGARDQSRALHCVAGLRQWGVAFLSYALEYDGHLPRVVAGAPGPARNRAAGAWYNELPPYVGAPRYGRIYDGSDEPEHGGYRESWIWYCPSLIAVDRKHSASRRNAFHYAMNNVVDGSGSFPYPGDPPAHVRADTIPRAMSTPLLTEPQVNVPYAQPNNPAGSGGNLARDRHPDATINLLFADGQVRRLRGPGVADVTTVASPWYARHDPTLIWGPFE